jgi:hypothetical protein
MKQVAYCWYSVCVKLHIAVGQLKSFENRDLGNEQEVGWWLQFRNIVSSHRHKRQQRGCGLHSRSSGYGLVAESCKRDNRASGSTKTETFLNYISVLKDFQGVCSMELDKSRHSVKNAYSHHHIFRLNIESE